MRLGETAANGEPFTCFSSRRLIQRPQKPVVTIFFPQFKGIARQNGKDVDRTYDSQERGKWAKSAGQIDLDF